MAARDPFGLIESGLPPELAAELMGVNRRQALADLLMAQSAAPIENIGGAGAVVSPLQGAAKMLQAYVGMKRADDADKTYANVAEKRRQGVADALMAYEQRKAGTPEIPMPPEAAGGGPGRPAVPGDTRGAIADALSNAYIARNPLVQADLAALKKSQEPYTLTPGGIRVEGGKTVASAPFRPQEHVIDGKVYVRDASGQLVEAGGPGVRSDPNKPFDPRTGAPNPAFQDYEKGKAAAGAAKVQTQVNAYMPASEAAQTEFMKSTRATYDQLKQAPVALASIEKAKALIPEAKGFMGPGGEALLGSAKFLNSRLGMSIDTEGVKSAEELRTRIFFNIMDNLKKMDAQPSQMQQQIMMESLGKLGTDPNALPAILDAYSEVIRGKVMLHNREAQGAIERGVKFPYDPIIGLETPAAAPQRRATDRKGGRLRFDTQGNPL